MANSSQNQTSRIEVPTYMIEQISRYAKQQRISRSRASEEVVAAGLDVLEAWQVGTGAHGLYRIEWTTQTTNSSRETEMGTDWHLEFEAETLSKARNSLWHRAVTVADSLTVTAKEVAPRVTAMALREPIFVGERYWRIIRGINAPR